MIQSTDTGETFHYVDPPYYNANMGHYGGYTKEDFIRLLEALQEVKGKFLLSSYPSDVLDEYVKKNGWIRFDLDKSKSSGYGTRKTECLTMNYELSEEQLKEAFIL